MAGVSLRTFNNYFTGKYEALAYRQTERDAPQHRRAAAASRRRAAVDVDHRGRAGAAGRRLSGRRGDENRMPSRDELAEVRKLLMRPEIRDAVSKELFDEWVEVIAERTGTDPDRDMYPRLVAAVGPRRR